MIQKITGKIFELPTTLMYTPNSSKTSFSRSAYSINWILHLSYETNNTLLRAAPLSTLTPIEL